MNIKDIIALVRKAMEREMHIVTSENPDNPSISIYNNKGESISFELFCWQVNTLTIIVEPLQTTINIEVSKKDESYFKVLYNEAREYEINKFNLFFENFFKEDQINNKIEE